jgi:hypothetical protein
MKRNIWIPKMTKGRLERLISKPNLTENDKEDLLDYKYFLLNEKVSAYEKNLMYAVPVSQSKECCDIGNYILFPKNKFWITNINHLTKGFESKYYL